MSAPQTTEIQVVLRASRGWLKLDFQELWQYRDLVLLMVRRDFVAKYSQTILGPLWFIVQPVLTTLVFTVVFGRIAGLSTDGLPAVLFYLCGQLGWAYFSQCFSANSATLNTNSALFGKVYFPRLVVPLSVLISNLFAFVIQFVTFIGFFAYYKFVAGVGGFGLDWRVIFLPLLVLQTALLSLGVGLLMSSLTAKYRDLNHVSTLLIQLWMYATPVIMPLSSIEARWHWVVALNPMTTIVESFRLLLLGKATVDPWHLLYSVTATIVIAFVGLMLFHKVERTFIDTV